MDKLIYIRTDRNGTKIYHDWTCPRCSGEGYSDHWQFTGRFCYECGGTGKRKRPKIVKEYTEEYAAKLDARREAKEAAVTPDEQAKKLREHFEKNRLYCFRENGCGDDGVGYILWGDTYNDRNRIKANGGKWCYGTAWVCPVEIQSPKFTAIKMDLAPHVNGYGCIPESSVVFFETLRTVRGY